MSGCLCTGDPTGKLICLFEVGFLCVLFVYLFFFAYRWNVECSRFVHRVITVIVTLLLV